MGKLYQKIDGYMVEVPLARPDDNVPILMALDTETLDSGERAGVTMVQLGDHIYGLKFRIPKGAEGAVLPMLIPGEVHSLPPGSEPAISFTPVDSSTYRLNIDIPKGEKGDPGVSALPENRFTSVVKHIITPVPANDYVEIPGGHRYVPGRRNLLVNLNGFLLMPGEDYLEADATSIQTLGVIPAGVDLMFYIFE